GRSASSPQLDLHLVSTRSELGAKTGAALGDPVEGRALLNERSRYGPVISVVPDELKRPPLDPSPIPRHPRHHAEPVAVLSAAVAGVKRKAAEPVEERLLL